MLILVVFSTCGNPKDALVGQWNKTSGGTSLHYLELFSDGTYTSDYSNYNGTFSVDDTRLRLSGILVEDLIFSFEVKEKELSLYYDGSETPAAVFENKS